MWMYPTKMSSVAKTASPFLPLLQSHAINGLVSNGLVSGTGLQAPPRPLNLPVPGSGAEPRQPPPPHPRRFSARCVQTPHIHTQIHTHTPTQTHTHTQTYTPTRGTPHRPRRARPEPPRGFLPAASSEGAYGTRPAVRGEPGAPRSSQRRGHCRGGAGRCQKPGGSRTPVCSRPSCCKSWRGRGAGIDCGRLLGGSGAWQAHFK